MYVAKIVVAVLVSCVFVIVVVSEPIPLLIRCVYGLFAVDIVLDFLVFQVVRCLEIHGKTVFSFYCFFRSIKRKASNKRSINMVQALNALYGMSKEEKDAVVFVSLLGPKIAKRKNPFLRIIFGGIPTLMRGGKLAFLRHHLSNPMSLDQFGMMVVSTAVASFLILILTGYGGLTIKPISIWLAGSLFTLQHGFAILLILFLAFVASVFVWNFVVYLSYLRLLHWIHWFNVFCRRYRGHDDYV
jgi:hypothetical protein